MDLIRYCEFHNLFPEPRPIGGWLLARLPASVRHRLTDNGRAAAEEATGGELRFVTDGHRVRLCLQSLDTDTEVHLYRGDYFVRACLLRMGSVQTLELVEEERFGQLREAEKVGGRVFAPSVWRVIFGRARIVLHYFDSMGGELRPPVAAEKPASKWLAYGSSITHSSLTGYPAQAGRRLAVDVQNKGLSGGCFAEPELARFFCDSCCWDLLTLELGINMRGHFDEDEFARRSRAFIDTCVTAGRGKPVVLITVLPEGACLPGVEPELRRRELAYNACLRELASEFEAGGVVLVEGAELLPELSLLKADLLHPTDLGQAVIAERLAARLGPILGKNGAALSPERGSGVLM
ncbi:MAG: SGNH/GDSL hydrolase family protein [Verrucomicrobiota bacterium JB024]|nr:SGNH/GDSL hydrolase family protein [Verrucomicrobiota bacterium JB024]